MPTCSPLPDSGVQAANLESESVFRSLIEGVSDYGIFVLDPAGCVSSWNIGAERTTGYRGDEIVGTNFSVLYTPGDIAKGEPANNLKIAQLEGQYQHEGWRLRKDGSRFWANVVLTPLLNPDGKLIGFGNIIRDLTERRHSELRYRLLVEGVIDYAIFSMDADGNITSWNAGAERLKGYKPEEIIGRNFCNFYTPPDRQRGLPQTVLATAAREGHFEGEGWRVRKNGELFWASVVVTPLRDEEGTLYGFSKVTRDMTERKRLLDTLQQHSEELELRIREREETNAELEAFAYSVSHDLRAPLRAISGFAEALREDCADQLDSRGRDYLDEITGAAARMNSLVQDLLDYGRVSRISVPLEPVLVSQAITEAVSQIGEEKRRGSLDVQVPAEFCVQAHPQVLTQVLLNLLSNAFKFQAKDSVPDVRLTAERRGTCIRISVRDNGIGIAPQHHERIWQVFERLHDRETFPGSGIGLAIVKRAMARMQGAYGMESEDGKGSLFWIELPETSLSKGTPA